MNYHPTNDHPINLEDVYKMLGFAHKKNAKRTLENNFTKDDDYKILVLPREQEVDNVKNGRNLGGAGLNKETVMLNIDTFKNMCMMAKTDKGKEIRKYYVKLENIYSSIIKQEMEERQKLLTENLQAKHKSEQNRLRETTLLEQFPKNTLCVYVGTIDNTSTTGESLLKFGISNDLNTRVGVHKSTYQNFCLMYAFKVDNHIHIENEIKIHQVLKRRIRSIIINNKSYTELIALNDTDFTIEKVEEYVKDIITQTQYNLKNYQILLDKCDNLQTVNYKLNDTIKELEDKITKLETNKTPEAEKTFLTASGTYNPTKGFYYLYAFQATCKDNGINTFKIGLCRKRDLEQRTIVYKMSDPDGKIAYKVSASLPLSEKVLLFLCKKNATSLRDNTFECGLATIQNILDSTSKLEEVLTSNSLNQFFDSLNSKDHTNNNPEYATVQKAKRPVVQLNKDTKEIIATYPSLVAAGKAIGCSDTAVGVALRNKSLCKGFLFAYSGISVEDQMKDQPIVKINCSTAERTTFDNIASAARDIGISAPALRQRILTNVHRDGFHWVFDKNATHYN